MKVNFPTLVLLLAIGSFIAAVPLAAVEFGVKAGANLSFAGKSSAIYNASNLLGVKGGGFISLAMGWFSSVQLGINYVTRGGRYYSVHDRSTHAACFHYLEIPLLANLSIIKKTLFIFAGPYYACLLGSTPLDDEHDWTWHENKLKRSDAGLTAGVRWRLKSFFVEAQYTLGLINVITNPDPSGDHNNGHKNHGAALLIGYVF